jgi:hypothetical protein
MKKEEMALRIVRKTVFFSLLFHLIANAAFGQVFPVFPSGTLPDGSIYRSTLTVANPTSSDISCTTRFQQNAQPVNVYSFPVGKSSYFVWRVSTYTLNPNNAYIPSYLVLTCDLPTSAEARYAFYSSAGTMLGEANVLASNPVTYAAFVLDHETTQTRTGLAITNDSDAAITATITVYDSNNSSATLTQSIMIDQRSTLTKFVDELTGWHGALGLVTVSAPSALFVSGLRFTGPVFSTLYPIVSK